MSPCRFESSVWKAAVAVMAVVLAPSWWIGCSQSPPPEVRAPLQAADDRVPVVFVPGVTGVALRDRATGELTWGKGDSVISPHDRGHGTARPLFADRGGPDLVPAGVIRNLRLLGVLRVPVYQPLVDLFEANGYQFGDLEQPGPTENFFMFAYDWRQDNVDSAALLAAQLERLRQVRGQAHLRVNLICQSNGAHICRYFAKFGSLDLQDAESGKAKVEDQLEVDRMILVGSSNGGSIRILREMNRGRKYVRTIGRFWAPETLFTYLSLYQDLPAYTRDLFVDPEGRDLQVDLFAAENWQKYGWSVFNDEIRQRLARKKTAPWFGTEDERFQFLRDQLDRAGRFHRVLKRDVEGFGATRYYLIMNTHNETASKAVLFQQNGRWQTAFEDDRGIGRRPTLRAVVITDGDGHATAGSQKWLSDQETAQIATEPIDVEGTHRRIILQPATHRAILDILNGDFDSHP
jgi:hypothetical protein